MSKSKAPLEIRQQRVFSEELKRKIVKDLVSKRTTLRAVVAEHQVNRNSVYTWLYKYSPQHEQKPILVVQMQSEETKNHELRQRAGRTGTHRRPKTIGDRLFKQAYGTGQPGARL